ncbi:putative phospholipase B-like 2 [Clonorchis sinensis]|uniref:Phospholipase B-like n=1 Tax=Clonorchis sinensis TaxID=79923 RepID=G7YJV2_CLOSI|nr:putative phospholipase B-like 2 [Clonorchis sinensis]
MRGLLHGIFIVIVINLVNSEDSRRLMISSVKRYGVDHFQFVEDLSLCEFEIRYLNGKYSWPFGPILASAYRQRVNLIVYQKCLQLVPHRNQFSKYRRITTFILADLVDPGYADDIVLVYKGEKMQAKLTQNRVKGIVINRYTGEFSKLTGEAQLTAAEEKKGPQLRAVTVQHYYKKHGKEEQLPKIIYSNFQIYLQMWQLKGISDAYKQIFVENSTVLTAQYVYSLTEEVLGIYLLQLSGDLSEILQALSLSTLVNGVNRFGVRWVSSPTCSALIKLTSDNVYLSHVTWAPYTSMLRVLKHYNFPWNVRGKDTQQVPGYAITFSSYPSTISSIDDFYVISSKLVTIETTIGNSNDNLWAIVRDGASSSVLEPFRVMAANRLADNGHEWVSYFRQRNSGTYNNQWMVFDAKLYSPGDKTLNKGLLTVAEQLPGIVKAEDVTHVLEQQTYWPSYNLAYFPVIYNLSGMPEKRAKYGDWFDYQKTARANIFRRDHVKVESMATMHRLMRYNDFTHDEYSKCACNPPYTAENGISARSDLNAPNGTYPISAFEYRIHGGTDVKLVDFTLIHQMNMVATSGPTYDDLPPFEWSKLPVPVPRPHMHPNKWMFKPIMTNFPDYTVTPQVKLPTLLKVFPEPA